MSKSTRFALLIMGWLMTGWAVIHVWPVESGGLAWWLLVGLPAGIVVTVLALGFATSVMGLAIALLMHKPK